MNIRVLNASGLKEFIASDEYASMTVIPISPHRAISHINNPRLNPEDIILILAYEGVQLAGYLGVLPDKLFVSGKQEKVGWLSCMWVDPQLRGKGIAQALLNTSFERWGNKILVTEFTSAAQGLYDKSQQFIDLAKPIGIRVYLRFCLAELLPRKNQSFKSLAGLLSVFDFALNLFNSVRLSLYSFKMKYYSAREITLFDESTEAFIASHSQKNPFKRNKAELEWIRHFPWLLQQNDHDQYSRKYHFSYWNKRFECRQFVLQNKENKIYGCLIISIRDAHMKVPFFFCEDEAVADAAKLILKVMMSSSACYLTVFHPALVKYFQDHRTPFLMKRTQQRHYIISKSLAENKINLINIDLQDGDADCAFT